MDENKPKKLNPGMFQKGQSGNPKGRAKGARTKFSESFCQDVLADWQAHGKEVMQQVRLEKPEVYFRVVSSLVVKEEMGNGVTKERIEEHLAVLEVDRKITELLGEREKSNSKTSISH